jgi:hypothetical protein
MRPGCTIQLSRRLVESRPAMFSALAVRPAELHPDLRSIAQSPHVPLANTPIHRTYFANEGESAYWTLCFDAGCTGDRICHDKPARLSVILLCSETGAVPAGK